MSFMSVILLSVSSSLKLKTINTCRRNVGPWIWPRHCVSKLRMPKLSDYFLLGRLFSLRKKSRCSPRSPRQVTLPIDPDLQNHIDSRNLQFFKRLTSWICSPMGSGSLTGKFDLSALEKTDVRTFLPHFQGAAMEHVSFYPKRKKHPLHHTSSMYVDSHLPNLHSKFKAHVMYQWLTLVSWTIQPCRNNEIDWTLMQCDPLMHPIKWSSLSFPFVLSSWN